MTQKSPRDMEVRGHDTRKKVLMYSNDTIEKFWDNIERGRPHKCWIWVGPKVGAGYGQLGRIYAHRLSWEIHNGPIPRKNIICHHCDTPSCVNPRHLYLGTKKTNMRDAMERGRFPVGEDHTSAKLTNNEVLEIRKLFSEGTKTKTQLANHYGVSFATVNDIIKRRYWKHL